MELPPEVLEMIAAKRREMELPARPPSALFNGKRVRAVGCRLHFTDPTQTLQEYYLTVLYETLGREWYEAENARGERAHIVVQWLREFLAIKTGEAKGIDQVELAPGQFSATPSGNLWSLLCFAHDIHTLRHGGTIELDDALVARLRIPREFQGARYEVSVAAASIRVGFEIEWYADTTRPLPEFKATHKESGHAIVVEAKSRKRDGVLGHKGKQVPEDELGPDVNKLFRAAKKKETDGHPLVIFIDLNLPPKGWSLEEWIAKLAEHVPAMRAAATSENPDKFAAIVFTNFSWHWGGDGPAPTPEWFILFSSTTTAPLQDALRGPLEAAASEYGKLPPDDDEVAT